MAARLSLIASVGVAVIALTSAFAAPAASDAKRLTVRTGPDLTIRLTRAGREVDYLLRGRYTITIRDTSRSHNVALSRILGPAQHGLRRSAQVLTSFAFVGTKTVTVRLRQGRYTVSCLRHSRPSRHAASPDEGMTDSFLVN
jgi:hypothetical protein